MNGFATLALASSPRPAAEGSAAREGHLDQARALDRFLREVEKRAFRIAQIALRDADDALDVVQDSMLHLARAYAARPSEEWRPLFHRILQNRIRDCQRRRRTRSRVFAWWTAGRAADEDDAPDPVEQAAATEPGPALRFENEAAMAALEEALRELPPRQQQAFLLRNFEELDVADTAVAMGCSEGSVKTHHFRAVQALRARLGEHWS
ncbi:MAG: RNA polymerase sigma factor [Steroidobacteraceae bacterium]|jgi:RNA polymerase sigma-70 factor (ECF subfamily)|nr:RNA polymerase sigma factor [Steroidobacteraceae bacterium]